MIFRAVPTGQTTAILRPILLECIKLVNAAKRDKSNNFALIGVPALTIAIERRNDERFDIEINVVDPNQ